MGTAKRLREARKAAGYTQAQVAKAFDISREAVALWESEGEKGTKPDIRKLHRLAELYRVSISDLLDESTSPQELTDEERRTLALLRAIRKDARDAWITIGGYLSGKMPERRRQNKGNNPERRLGPDIPPDTQDTSLYNHDPMDEIDQLKERKRK